MLIALLAVLGVDLIVIVVVAAGVISRRRWISRQPGAFRGAIGVADGELHGFGSKWSRGYGRWVRDVLVWNKAPLLFRNELVVVDGMHEERTAAPGEVKRLGDRPVVVAFNSGGKRVEIAASGEQRRQLLGAERPDPTPESDSASPWTTRREYREPTGDAPVTELESLSGECRSAASP